VIGVRSLEDVERQRAGVLRWERRIVRAVGSPAQAARLRADEQAEQDRLGGTIAGTSPIPHRLRGAGSPDGSGSSQGPGRSQGSGPSHGSEEGRR